MPRFLWLGAIACTTSVCWMATARSEVVIATPFGSRVLGSPALPGGPTLAINIPYLVNFQVRQNPPIAAPVPFPATSPNLGPVPVPAPPSNSTLPTPQPMPAQPEFGGTLPTPQPAVPGFGGAMPTPPLAIPVRPLTVNEFAASFRPMPGNYEVVLLHPYTKCPVKVCFSLPTGCPKKVRVSKRKLEFSYGCCHDVTVRFRRNGSVDVRAR